MNSPVGKHLEGLLAAHRPAEGHHWGGAEKTDVHPWGREASISGRNSQVAGSHELAAGSGGDPVHPRNHRLGNLVEEKHHLHAGGKDGAILLDISRCHLADVMAGGKNRPVAPEYDDLGLLIPADRTQAIDHLLDEVEAEGIPFIGPVHGHGDNGTVHLNLDFRVGHHVLLVAGCGPSS
jgi:hypothetical protein